MTKMGAVMPGRDSRYETIRDYVLLALCAVLSLAGMGVIARGDVQGGVALLGAGAAAGGLVPTIYRDKGDRRD